MKVNQWRESEEAEDGLSEMPSSSSCSPSIRAGIRYPENPPTPEVKPDIEDGWSTAAAPTNGGWSIQARTEDVLLD